MDVSGTYTLDGDQLTLNPNVDTYKAEVLSVSMNGKVSEDPTVIKNIESMLNSPMVKAEVGEADNYTIKLADPMLELAQDDETLTLMRFSTIKN